MPLRGHGEEDEVGPLELVVAAPNARTFSPCGSATPAR